MKKAIILIIAAYFSIAAIGNCSRQTDETLDMPTRAELQQKAKQETAERAAFYLGVK